MNMLSVAWKLSFYQVWNRKRRWSTVAMFLLPVLLVLGIAMFARHPDTTEFYKGFVTNALGFFLIPFVAVFWGTAVLTDEIEGKTLVYLWTRPRHRGTLLLLKLMFMWVWLALLVFSGVAAGYLFAYSTNNAGGLLENLPVLLWDWRALTLAAIAYSSIGFLFSVLFRKPLTYAILLVYAWEVIPNVGPGFLKRISIRQQMLALVTHKEEPGRIAKTLMSDVVITEMQAIATLLVVAAVCCVATVFIAPQREFLSDDPARNQ